MATFLIKSHFISVWNNMTKKIKHGAIQKVCHLHNGIFHPIQLCQHSTYSSTSVLFTKLHLETIKWKKRRFFGDMAASVYHVI